MKQILKPMTLGEILDRTVQIYRARFWVFVGIAAIPAIAMFAVHLADDAWLNFRLLVRPPWQGGVFVWGLVVWLAFYHIASAFRLFMMPAMVNTSATTLLGSPASLVSAVQFVGRRWAGWLWVAFLKYALQLIAPEITAFALLAGLSSIDDATGGALVGSTGSPWSGFWMLFVSAALGILLFSWMGSCLSLMVPVAALDELPAGKALRRSWKLTRGARFRIFVVWSAIFLFELAVWFVLQFPLRWMFIYLRALRVNMALLRLYQPTAELLNAAIQSMIGPLLPIALTAFYYDQRVRREGYDIELLMDAAGMTAAPAPQTAEYTGAVRKS